MYYHVIVGISDHVDSNSGYKEYYELDITDLHQIEQKIISPFLNKQKFQFKGYFLNPGEIRRLVVLETNESSNSIRTSVRNAMVARTPSARLLLPTINILQQKTYSKDITDELQTRIQALIDSQKNLQLKEQALQENENKIDMNKIFIVHGRDDSAKTEVARFVEKLGYSAIILHEQVNAGKTIIEKIDEHTNVGFGLVLYTPCDIGGLVGDENQKNRARQNVVFEHGYLMGKIGRNKVCALVKGDIETPNDISGVVYVPLDDLGAWKMKVAKEMRDLGYQIDMNKII